MSNGGMKRGLEIVKKQMMRLQLVLRVEETLFVSEKTATPQLAISKRLTRTSTLSF
jgi:hypothetical protein